jgi:hypothetical protein
MAVFEVTNRTSGEFCYEVGNFALGMSNGVGTVHDLGTRSVGYLPAHTKFTFTVPIPPGTNEWRVMVEAWEVGKPYASLGRGPSGIVARTLRRLDIYDSDPKSYRLISPGFSRTGS